MDKLNIDSGYARWIQNELRTASSRKGPHQRARRREAGPRDSEATGPAEPMGRRKHWMSGRWLVVAVVVVNCCSVLAGWIGGGWLLLVVVVY